MDIFGNKYNRMDRLAYSITQFKPVGMKLTQPVEEVGESD
jgi:hypothetical protein